MASEAFGVLEAKQVGRGAPQATEAATESLIDKAHELMKAGDFESAQTVLEDAHDAEPDNARVQSSLGLCIAKCSRQFERAVELCNAAAKLEFFNPEHYLNLARVHLTFGFRAEGRRYLLRGQMIDPGNMEIAQALEDLGSRCDPILRFLPRGHRLNRWLGSARHVLVGETA